MNEKRERYLSRVVAIFGNESKEANDFRNLCGRHIESTAWTRILELYSISIGVEPIIED